MRRLRFLHLSTFYPPYSFGGDATFLYRLCHLLGDEGHQVDVVHCVDSYHLAHPGEPKLAYDEHPNVTRYELRSGYGRLSPLLTQQTGRPYLKRRQIRELLGRRSYDVVHFHNISLLGPKILTMPTASERTVTIYTAHEHWLVCPMHVLWKYNCRPCERPACLSCQVQGRRPPQLWRYTRLMERCSRSVDRFLAPSEFTADMHRQRGFPQPFECLPHFASAADKDWQRPGPRPQQRPYFLFVGRLVAIKGVQTLISLWPRVPDADLLVAGTGTYETELRKLAADNPSIKFLGALPQDKLGNLYVHALACLVPSLTFETFGLTSIESFARKTPVLARDIGALGEVIDQSGGGFVYRTDDELRQLLPRIAGSPELRAELGERGYQAFRQRWSPEAHLRRYLEILEETARRKFGHVPWQGDMKPECAGQATIV